MQSANLSQSTDAARRARAEKPHRPGDPYTVRQFAGRWNVSLSTVWRWIAEERLQVIRPSEGVTRILPEHEAAFIAAGNSIKDESAA